MLTNHLKKEAKYYKKEKELTVQCQLCPHYCRIRNGKEGICRVRRNSEGTLYAENYGLLSAKHLDPIEKKPLYHFYPGQKILSAGTVGCNLQCQFCQNCEISQTSVEEAEFLKFQSPKDLVNEAKLTRDNIGIAYTYNEPTIWFEYILDAAKIAKTFGLKNVMISNGFINPAPRKDVISLMDAFNIDLKGFTEEFYKSQTFSSLKNVKETILNICKEGKHLEITNLVIPTLNDDPDIFRNMVEWIAGETGTNTVLHLSRYFPHFNKSLPPTEVDKLVRLFDIAREFLNYVYIGNVGAYSAGRNTICPSCDRVVIERSGYSTDIAGLNRSGECIHCKNKILKYI